MSIVIKNPQPIPPPLWNKLTFLRGICAFYVMISHAWYQVWPAAEPPLGYRKTPEGIILAVTGWLYNGHFAVVVFIVISGYSLGAATMSRKGTFRFFSFMKRRIRRIVPPYYWAMGFSLMFALIFSSHTGSQWDISIPVTLFSVIVHIVMLQDIFEPTSINYTHWSIAVEFQLYMLFPIFLYILLRYNRFFVTLFFSSVIIGIFIILDFNGVKDYTSYIGLILYFFFGVVSAVYVAHRGYSKLSFKVKTIFIFSTIAISCILFVGIIFNDFDKIDRNLFIFDFGVSAVACFLIILLACNSTKIVSANNLIFQTSYNIFLKIGHYSYSLYLVHAPILAVTWLFFNQYGYSELAMFIVTLIVGGMLSIILSYLFYLKFEYPYVGPRKIQKNSPR
ncbi:O-acetyltransferase OatA [Rothia dentocariosa]|jgi:acyltransferase 3|uniref:O-acetyltransferase OatA n=1 Tax=Rothia dentocariosa TaxID=2047 RepID=A0A3S4Y5I9_9MICC|nr:O-acetyltransferase OatA [Rothia dentocariosa]